MKKLKKKLGLTASNKWLGWWPEVFFGVICVLLIHRLFVYCLTTQSDYEVYWYAARAWLDGKAPYLRYNFSFPGLVFKYPPWILPFFIPLAWMSLQTSKFVWLIIQIASIGYSVWWTIKRGVNPRVAYSVALMLWYNWFANAYFGQIMVVLLAICLWSCESSFQRKVKADLKLAVLAFALSAKIFPLFSIVGLWKRVFRLRPVLMTIGLVLLAHGILFFTAPQPRQSLVSLYPAFVQASASSGSELRIIRGPQNHGFTKAILNALNIDETWVSYDIGFALALLVLLGGLWYRFSKELTVEEGWSGWLAISVITHPLAWHHSFVMVYPLCAFALHRTMQTRKIGLILGALLGIFLIGLLVPQTVGVEFLEPFGKISNKSWGVLICGMVLVIGAKKSRLKRAYG